MDSKQVIDAMAKRLPVTANGIQYQRITEYILSYDDHGKAHKSVSLLDKNGCCIVRVPVEKVEEGGHDEQNQGTAS